MKINIYSETTKANLGSFQNKDVDHLFWLMGLALKENNLEEPVIIDIKNENINS